MRTRVTGAGVAAVVLAGGLTVMPTTAVATPPSGVSGRILVQKTVGQTDYILREITVQPGGTTGWHFHDGTLYAYVKQGTLTHHDSTCATDGVYRTGTAFIEPSGPDHVHLGRNLASSPLILEVLYVLPTGSPLSEDAPNPGCPFQ